MKDSLREHLSKAGKASADALTKKQRSERARKAGKASGKARRKKGGKK
jgi:hypothetical protein